MKEYKTIQKIKKIENFILKTSPIHFICNAKGFYIGDLGITLNKLLIDFFKSEIKHKENNFIILSLNPLELQIEFTLMENWGSKIKFYISNQNKINQEDLLTGKDK